MSLTGNHRLRLVILAALMITFALPAALYSSSLAGNHSLNDKTPVRTPQAGFSGFATLGFDCGYGSNEAPANATGIASPDGATNTGNAGNPTFDSQCTWAGSADIPLGGTQLQPLVSDNPSLATCGCFAPSRGGGFTAEIVFIQNSTTLINGFDITVSWDPKILQFVEFDQGGLPWFGGNSFTATNIFDNGLGSAELSQAILSPPAPLALLAGNQTLFRMRFDVVGIGRTALKISNDQIIDANLTPNNVHHITRQSNFQSSNIPDLVAGITLGYNASWTFTPNPEVPGSPLTLLAATATCPGCTGPLTYKWDTDSVQGYPDTTNPAFLLTPDFTGQSAIVTLPTATVLGHRVTLIVNDTAGHVATATRRLPLTLSPPAASSATSNVATSLTAAYLGGIPPYSGTTGQVGVKWIICNSTGLSQTICSLPSPVTTTTAAQTNTISEIYKWQGVFTGSVAVTDTAEAQLPATQIYPGSPSSISATFAVNVTGGTAPPAYTLAVTSNATSGATTAQVVNFTATVTYNVNYNSLARSTTFSYTFLFGDGQIGLFSGGAIGKATHKYAAAGNYPVVVIAQETGSNALAKIQEVGRFTQSITGGVTPPTVSITTAPTSGSAGTAVMFTATASGGTTPYSFSWNFGDGTGNQAGGATNPNSLSHTYTVKGTYTVHVNVTDSESPAKTASATPASITINPAALTVAATIPSTGTVGTPVSVSATASGGTAPYTFSWNFGDGTGNFAGQAIQHTYTVKGTYTIKVNATDHNNVVASTSQPITISPLTLTVTPTVPTTGTVGTAVSVSATASGGTTPYTFSWNFGDGTGNFAGASIQHTYTVKGTYTVKVNVTDHNSVVAAGVSSTIAISPQTLTVTPTVPSTGVVGTAVSVSAAASGGTAPYTFSWNFGDGTGNFAGQSIQHTYTVKGTYTVKVNVTDHNTVVAAGTSSSILINPLPLTITPTIPSSGTVGTAVSVSATASGGTSPYTFSWNFGDGTGNFAGASVQHTYTVKGTYTVKVNVTDHNGVITPASSSITISPTPLLITPTIPASGTVGTAVSVSATASGGTSPYTFSWNFGDGTGNFAGQAIQHTYTVKGTYTVKVNVTDHNGAITPASSTILINPLPLTITPTIPTSGTVGTAVSVSATASGGTAPYTFSWNFGDGTGNFAGASVQHTYTVKGTYTVKVNVTDHNGVVTPASGSILINPLALRVTPTVPTTGTVGTAVSVSATGSGGTTPYTFSWNFGDGTGNFAGQAIQHTYTVKGTYTVKVNVTDHNAVVASASSSILINPLPLTITPTIPATGTVGTAVSVSATASGGTAPYTFSWNFGDGTGNFAGASIQHTYTVKGTYTVKVNATDHNGVIAPASSSITISPLPLTITPTIPASGTVGTAVAVSATASGGTSPYTFSWNFGDGTGNFAGASIQHTYTVKGTYTVKVNVTDHNGAITPASSSILISPLPLAITPTIPATGVVGTAVSVSATASGGTTPYTFSWNFGDGTGNFAGQAIQHTYTVKGTYTVKVNVTDHNGVITPASSSIMISPLALAITPTVPGTGVVGTAVSVSATASGGTTPYTFSWNFGDGTGNFAGQAIQHTYTVKGTYSVNVNVTDHNGVVTRATASAIMITPLALAITPTIPATGVVGTAVSVSATASGGTTPYTFSWNFGDGTGNFAGASIQHTYTVKGTYTVKVNVTDHNGVITPASSSIMISPLALAITPTVPATGTVGTAVSVSASATGGTTPYTFSWNFGDGTGSFAGQAIQHTYTVKGTYSVNVNVTDHNGVVTRAAASAITISPLALVATSTVPATGVVGTAVSVSASATGGTTPYTFSWNFGDGTGNFAGQAIQHTYTVKGTYTVKVNATDHNGVVAPAASKTITISPLTLTITPTIPGTGVVGTAVSVSATASGGTAPYTFSWNFGDGTGNFAGASIQHTYTVKGTYTVKVNVTDHNGVIASASSSIMISPLTLTITPTIPATGTVGTAVSVSASASGGTSPYTFSWNFGDGTGNFAGQAIQHTYTVKGTYTVKVNATDHNGVIAPASASIMISPQPLTSSFVASPSTIVPNSPETFTATTSGGTAPYTYAWNFGDGSTGTGNPVQHTYTVSGTFTVRENVTDHNGVKFTTTQQVGGVLTVTLSCPANGVVGTAISCTATASGGTTPFSFSWNFGDGTGNFAGGSTNPNVMGHTYSVKGAYTVHVNVTDSATPAGLASAAPSTVMIAPQTLTVTPTVPTTGVVGTAVSVSATASGGTTPYTFSWNFGDGTGNFAGQAIQHTYTVKGTYTVKVNVTDHNGVIAPASSSIMISPLTLKITPTIPATGTVGTAVSVSATASGGTSPYTFSWNFGDGTGNFAGQSIQHTYTVKGTYTVKVNATDHNGVIAPASSTIVISPTTLIVTATIPGTGVVGTPVSVSASASGGTAPYTFSWNFGDGTGNFAGQAIQHTYTVKGTYTVKVNATDHNGVIASTSSPITISPLTLTVTPTVPATGVVGTAVSVSASASGGTAPYTFSWNFGDGTGNFAGQSIQHTYTVKGTYTVNVNVTDHNGVVAKAASSTIMISPQTLTVTPSVPTGGTVGTPVSVSASASGGTAPYTFSWNFGDGTGNFAGQAIQHTYAVKGSFVVHVNATDHNGVIASASSPIVISSTQPTVTPTVPATGTVGTAVSVSATAAGGTAPFTFSWNFGDGTGNFAGQAIQHTYTVKGTYTVKVNATDHNGAIASASSSIMISPLTLTVTPTVPATGTVGTAVSVSASASGGTAPYTFSWNFGDGTGNFAGQSIQHTYTVKGTYTVKVNATDHNGVIASASSTIMINPQPLTASITIITTGPFVVGSPITFTATITGGTAPYTCTWNWGDGTPLGTGCGPIQHTYATKGSKTVMVSVVDRNMATTSAQVVLTVQPLPLAVSISGPTTGTVGTAVQFTATATGGTTPYTFSWTFGDGTAAVTGNPASHTYTVKGTYTVTVNATDFNGIIATKTAQIMISPLALTISATVPSTGMVGTAVSVSATASGGTAPYTFSWNFGDGTGNFAGQSIQHTYTFKGTYTVNVNATDHNGLVKGATPSTILISPLVLSVTPTVPTTGVVGTAVSVSATAVGGTTPYTFSWNFGDGTGNFAGASIQHTYSVKGTYTVNVNATDHNGVIASAGPSSIMINPLALTSSFVASPTSIVPGGTETFTATTSGGTAPYTYAWNFGDGTTGSGNPAMHIYSTAGPFTVRENVTDHNGVKFTTTQQVGGKLTVTINCPSSGIVGTPVNCSATSSGGTPPVSFSWTATGGNPSSGMGSTFSTTYGVKGTYTISVTGTDSATPTPNTDTKSANVMISPLSLSVTPSVPTTGTVGTAVGVSATASGGTAPYTFSWNFGDGTPNVAGSPASHVYSVKGSYTVKVNGTDHNGVIASASSMIAISPCTLAVSITGPAVGTVNVPYQFTAAASCGTAPYTFSWNFGDGTPNVAGNPASHSYSVKGTYTIKVNVTDHNGVLSSTSTTFIINPAVLAVTPSVPTTGVVGTPVSVSATAVGGTTPYTFSWNFGDGTGNFAGASIQHSYAVKGTYMVKVNVTDHNGVIASASATIVISPLTLTVSFMFSPTSPVVGQQITFTASASGGTAPYVLFSWNFGDGSILSNGAQVMHAYTVKGTYMVTVTVTDHNAATANTGKSVTVSPLALTASFTVNPTSPVAGQQATFTATVSGGTSPYTFSWSFGDNTAKATTNPATHIYQSSGPFTVSLNVTDMNGVLFKTSQSVTVQPAPLTVDFTFTPTNPTVNQAVTFTATSQGGTPPVSFTWTFGDGTSGTGSPVQHSYSVKGTFPVTLTGTDAAAKTASIQKMINVTPLALIVSFTFSPTSPSVGSQVIFTAMTSGGTAPYSYSWNFGDGSAMGSGNPAAHTYTTKGTFMVVATVTDMNLASASASKSITVTPQPLSTDFQFSPSSPTIGTTVTFTATTTGGTTPYSYSWNFGDSSPMATGNPVMHSYSSSANFTVTETVTDMNGQTATATHIVTVSKFVQPLTADFGPTSTLVGNTTFVGVISGGVSPHTCLWNFGDGSTPQYGCSPGHVYIATGNFTVVLTVTDSAGSTASATHVVTVQVAPTVDAITFRAHPFFPSQEDFKYHVSNLSTIPLDMTVTLTITDGDGQVVSSQTQTITLGPVVQTKFDLLFTPTAKVTYTFTSNMTYQATIPVGAGTTLTTTVTGSGPAITGTFTEK